MPNPITTLLARTSESIGAVKAARRSSPNRVNYWPADEMNKALDFLVLASGWLGLSDGSTPNTIFQALRAFSGPRATIFKTYDDFDVPSFVTTPVVGATAPYLATVVGAGSTVLSKPALNEVGGGNGIYELSAAAVASGSAMLSSMVETLRGSQLPDLRIRFKTPATFTGADMRIGFSNLGETNYARIRCNATSTVSAEIKSVTGGATVSYATSLALALSTWYELRVRILAGHVEFYVNDAMIVDLVSASATPVAGDTLCHYLAKIDRSAGGPHVLNLDFYELAATRL